MADKDELTVVVIAGAAARGAYEAGAMAEVLPRELRDLRNTVFLGTSAGAINAALWAAFAAPGKPLSDVGAEVCDVWRQLRGEDVFHLLSRAQLWLPPALAGWLPPIFPRGMRWLGIARELMSVFDTGPLDATARRILDTERLRDNVARGVVRGVGVVATSVSPRIAGGRSNVFLDTTLEGPFPGRDAHAIDFVRTEITHDHVLASAAIPALFPARMVSHPPNVRGYYIDGGVRLNAPFSPAVALNATRVIVISSHPVHYPRDVEVTRERSQTDVLQVIAQSVHSVLGDGLIEDLHQLRRINQLVTQDANLRRPTTGEPYRLIPHLVVAPDADDDRLLEAQRETPAPWREHPRTRLLDLMLRLVGEGPGAAELMSYLRFDRPYAEALMELGADRGREARFTLDGKQTLATSSAADLSLH